ncbi:MAG: DNA polymerase III subunit beta [Coprobacillus sp.]|nr:DNA polymerase III subunit beta [Coprobacillus sp.]
MRFTIKREELLKGLSVASRAVTSKVPQPIFLNLKLDLNEAGLFITGSNNEYTIKTRIPFKNENGEEIIRNYKEGSTLLQCKYIVEMVRKMEGDEVTLEVLDSTIATISDDKSDYHLNCIRSEEYPDIDLDVSGVTFDLKTPEFSQLVEQTAFAASTKEQRPILTAINLEASGGVLTATATDSARMARKTIENLNPDIEFVANIPARTMVEIQRLSEGASNISISVTDKKALFEFKDTIVHTRLVAGDYPNTKNIVPKTTNYTLHVNAAELLKAIDRANVLASERENAVDLSMSEEAVNVSSSSVQTGSASEKVEPFKFEGEELKISFNSTFVSQAVNAVGGEDVTFRFVGDMKPFVVENDSDPSIIQVVTPVRPF